MKHGLILFIVLPLVAKAQVLTVTTIVLNAGCGNATGSIQASISGSTLGPFTYLWSPVPPAGQGTSFASGLLPGGYWVHVSDIMGNTDSAYSVVGSSATLNVQGALNASPTICPMACQGSISISTNLLGGMPPFSITTTPPMTVVGSTMQGVCADVPIIVNVEDALGCTGSGSITIPATVVPSVTGSLVTCDSTGTATILFFDPFVPVGGYWTDPNGLPAPGGVQFGGLAVSGIAGIYTYTAYLGAGCIASYNATLPSTPDCTYLTGSIYFDANGDCERDLGELGRGSRIITIQPDNIDLLTTSQGFFATALPIGPHSINRNEPNTLQICPGPAPLAFLLDSVTPNQHIDLGDTTDLPDLSLTCVGSIPPPRPGLNHAMAVHLYNQSPAACGPFSVTLRYDTLLTFVSSSLTTFLVTDSTISWSIAGMAPFDAMSINTVFSVPADPLLTGTVLIYHVTSDLANDLDPSNSSCSTQRTIVNSWDPNDKQVYTNSGSESIWSLTEDTVITYTIRFQNTGTAPAIHVTVVDTLAADLDLRTLRILGTSHFCNTTLSVDRVLRFTFDHINLIDSTTYEPGSHGYAQFSIRPVPGLLPGQIITNTADIFFDFNPPIRTNTTELFVDLSTELVEGQERDAVLIYPVPVQDRLFIRSTENFSSARIIGVDGRITTTWPLDGISLHVSALPSGVHVLELTRSDGSFLRQRFVKE